MASNRDGNMIEVCGLGRMSLVQGSFKPRPPALDDTDALEVLNTRLWAHAILGYTCTKWMGITRLYLPKVDRDNNDNETKATLKKELSLREKTLESMKHNSNNFIFKDE